MFRFTTAVVLLIATNAYSHDAPSGWTYPFNCCAGLDCRLVPAASIREGRSGYTIANTGELIPYGDPRLKISPDGSFHWCSRRGEDDTPTICLFIPPPGS